jgi:hypothetical protein
VSDAQAYSNCHCLPHLTDAQTSIVKYVQERGVKIHAIVDVGAVFAGQENLAVAQRLLDILPVNQYPGVVFFDNLQSPGQWKILERSGRLLPKDQSPVLESEAFAFFDEPRCRGADLKLNSAAVAVLTLGKKMCKDTFMQAAGRMRNLGFGQKLVVVGTKDVMDQVRKNRSAVGSKVEAKHVLEWTMRNTCESNIAGLVSWAVQGLFHWTSSGNADMAVQDEVTSVHHLYGGAFLDVDVKEAVRVRLEHLHHQMSQAGVQVSEKANKMLCQLLEKVARYGGDAPTIRAVQGADEECERELDIERELDKEEEKEIPIAAPACEVDWPFHSILAAKSPTELPSQAGVLLLCDFIYKSLEPKSIARISWTGRVYGSGNFFKTVDDTQGHSSDSCLNNYLRLVDVGLFFPQKNEVLLISEREADVLIGNFWENTHSNVRAEHNGAGPILFHLSVIRNGQDKVVDGLATDMLTLNLSNHSDGIVPPARLTKYLMTRSKTDSSVPAETWLEDELLAEIQLFAGETVFSTESRRSALKGMLRQGNHQFGPQQQRLSSSAEPVFIVEMRGLSHCLPYSHLEQICKDVAREEDAMKMSLAIQKQQQQQQQREEDE